MRFAQDRRGVAAVEFALVAPIFLLIIAGIIVFGFYFAIQVAVTEAASEGARLSVAGLTAAEPGSTPTRLMAGSADRDVTHTLVSAPTTYTPVDVVLYGVVVAP